MPAHRFERGVDPELPRIAIERATRLIVEIAGGTPGPVDRSACCPSTCRNAGAVALRRARLARVLGMQRRRCRGRTHPARARPGRWTRPPTAGSVTPPTRRFDIAIEEDLIEEIARIHGYDAHPDARCRPAPRAWPRRAKRASTSRRCAASWPRAITSKRSTTPSSTPTLLQRWQRDRRRGGAGQSAERRTRRDAHALLPGLVAALGAQRRAPAAARAPVRARPACSAKRRRRGADRDPAHRGGGLRRRARPSSGAAGRAPVDFHDLKGDLESLAAAVRCRSSNSARRAPPAATPAARPTSTGRRRERGRIGWIGQLHPRLQRALDLDVDVVAFELDLAPLLRRALPRASDAVAVPVRPPGPRVRRPRRRALGRRCRRTVQAAAGAVAAGSGAVRPLRRARASKPDSRVSLWA